VTDTGHPTSKTVAPSQGRFSALAVFGVVVVTVAGVLWYSEWQPDETPSGSDLVERSARFGVFRDLLLIERPTTNGGPFFLDRFETTQGDWSYFEAAIERNTAPEGAEKVALAVRNYPVTSVSLAEARRFAQWRFCRLPRLSELMYASTQGGASQYPWGDRWVETWANTHGLSLGRTAPVGSFESGRSASGPYDLIGNVAEWTESVDLPKSEIEILDTSWMRVQSVPGVTTWLPAWSPLPVEWLSMGEGFLSPEQARASAYRILEVPKLPGVSTVEGAVGLTCWLPPWSPRPLEWFVMSDHLEQARLAAGGHFRTTVGKSSGTRLSTFPLPRGLFTGRKSDTTGMRLAASPDELLRALLESGVRPSVDERRLLVRFLSQPDHRRVLSISWQWLQELGDLSAVVGNPIADLLASELGT
jgi:hypothetical protein